MQSGERVQHAAEIRTNPQLRVRRQTPSRSSTAGGNDTLNIRAAAGKGEQWRGSSSLTPRLPKMTVTSGRRTMFLPLSNRRRQGRDWPRPERESGRSCLRRRDPARERSYIKAEDSDEPDRALELTKQKYPDTKQALVCRSRRFLHGAFLGRLRFEHNRAYRIDHQLQQDDVHRKQHRRQTEHDREQGEACDWHMDGRDIDERFAQVREDATAESDSDEPSKMNGVCDKSSRTGASWRYEAAPRTRRPRSAI